MLDSKLPLAIPSLMAELSIGDRATLDFRMDTVKNKPYGFEDGKFIRYDIKVLGVMDSLQLVAYLEKKSKAAEELSKKLIPRESIVKSEAVGMISKWKDGSLIKSMKETSPGVHILVKEEGTGMQARILSTVATNYAGFLKDGKCFDNSFKTGKPFFFRLGSKKVIPGWDIGFKDLKQGTKGWMIVDAAQAYGDVQIGDMVPPNSDLLFYFELQDVY